MPTVPTTFVPQVAPPQGGDIGDFAAPGVQPMESLAGQQVERMGRAVMAAGNVAFRAGSAIQDDLDNAQAKAADTAGIRGATPLAQSYLNLTGKDAETQYQQTIDGIRSALMAPMDGLQTKTARAMYEQVAARNLAQFEAQVGNHRLRETKKYAANEAAARSQARADLAVFSFGRRRDIDPLTGREFGTALYEVNYKVAMDEAVNAASLQGIPADSAQMEAIKTALNDRIATGVVNELMRSNDYAGARDYLDSMIRDENVTAGTAEALNKSVTANIERLTVDELAQSIILTGQAVSATDPKTYPMRETGLAPPYTLGEALVRVDLFVKDPDMKRLVEANVRQRWNQSENLADEEYATRVFNIEQQLASGTPMSELDPVAFGALLPVDRERIMRTQEARDDRRVMDEFMSNPDRGNDWLMKNRGRMSYETFTRLAGIINKPEKVLEASVDAQQVNRTLIDAGMSNLASPDKSSKSDWEASLIMRDEIRRNIEAEQAVRGRKLSDEEKQPIIDRAIMDAASIKRTTFGIDWLAKDLKMPLAAMNAEQIKQATVDYEGTAVPATEWVNAQTQLRNAGIANPSREAIMSYLIRKGIVK